MIDVKSYWRRYTIHFGIIVLFVLGVALSEPEVRRFLNANQGAVSIVLSTLLVLLYFGQYTILKDQQELSDRPHLELQDYEYDAKTARVWLANHGHGVATDLSIVTEVDFEPTEKFAPSTGKARLKRSDAGEDEHVQLSNSLQPLQEGVAFEVEPIMGMKFKGEEHYYGLLAGTSTLHPSGVEKIRFKFFIEGSDLLGRKQREALIGWEKEVELDERGVNFEDVVVRGQSTSTWDDF